ncbi:MAG: hypothetical protein GY744_18865 [Gammaproteobacteria bacterium]|nr:hypothetical protein [Gammaproteobacteria bacterium]
MKLLLSFLEFDHEWIHVDILAGETKQQSFLASNPNGQIPLLELDDARYPGESNAIMNYLAAGSRFLPVFTFR